MILFARSRGHARRRAHGIIGVPDSRQCYATQPHQKQLPSERFISPCYLKVSETEFKIPAEPFQSRYRPAQATRKRPRLVLGAHLRDENVVMNVLSNENLVRKTTEEPDSSNAL
jgi:hypothetical protein